MDKDARIAIAPRLGRIRPKYAQRHGQRVSNAGKTNQLAENESIGSLSVLD
jgi:hypothetical protein